MRAGIARAVIFPILFGASLMLPSSIGAEETGQPPDGVPRERGDWMRSGGFEPNTDWNRFRRILVHPLDVAYTPKSGRVRHTHYPSELRPEDLERARRYFQRAFEKKMARSYPVTTDPGPDVLRVDAVLVDAAPDKSWWLRPGAVVLRGEAGVTLVVVLRDSETGAVLHRVNLPLRVGSLGFEDSATNYWGYLRLIFDRVATRVRWALDDAPAAAPS